jgi:hypothetical protein
MSSEPLNRHQTRLAALPAVYRTNHERLACELAMRFEEPLTVFARYGYDKDQALALLQNEEFGRLLEKVNKEVREKGLSFRAKARAMAEDLLPEAYAIATDDEASASVRADIIQWMTRVADLEPAPKDKGQGGAGGGGFSLQIVFAGDKPQKVVSQEPLTIEG